MKLWIVTAVDIGDSCDSKARVLLATQDYEEAKAYVHDDIEEAIDERTDDNGMCDFEVDFDGMSITDDAGNGCEWNVESVEVE